MRKFLKTLLTIGLIFSLSACADNGNENGGEEESPEMSEETADELTVTWQERRDEFVDLAENQIEEFEEQIAGIREENGDEASIEEIENGLEEVKQKLEDLEGETLETEENWEEIRDEITGAFVEIQTKIDEL